MDGGTVIATDDLDEYNYLYGLTPRGKWPVTIELPAVNGPVSGPTAGPRYWGPTEVTVEDVTPAAWASEGLEPNDLDLIALPDGRQLLASADDDAAHVWSVRDGKKVRTVSGHSEWVLATALCVLADGKVVLATGGKDSLARMWSLPDGAALQEIEAHRGPVNSVAWACPRRNIPWLITGGDDAHVRVWDVEFRRTRCEFQVGEPSGEPVWSVAAAVLSTGEVCVVSGSLCYDAVKIHVWNATSKAMMREFVLESDGSGWSLPKVAVATLADRSFRVAAIAGSVLRVWDGHTGQELRTMTLPGERGGDVAPAVLPDLRVVVAATSAQETMVWEVESGERLVHLTGMGSEAPVDLAVRPDGTLLLATGRRGEQHARLLRLALTWTPPAAS
jgi:WD40 repeat protein